MCTRQRRLSTHPLSSVIAHSVRRGARYISMDLSSPPCPHRSTLRLAWSHCHRMRTPRASRASTPASYLSLFSQIHCPITLSEGAIPCFTGAQSLDTASAARLEGMMDGDGDSVDKISTLMHEARRGVLIPSCTYWGAHSVSAYSCGLTRAFRLSSVTVA